MITKSERKGNQLILTVDLAAVAYKSKSAIAKALDKGLDADTVVANMLATTGGFQRCGDVKVSLNVLKV